MRRKQLQEAYDKIYNRTYTSMKKENALLLLLERIRVAQLQKERDSMRRIILNYIEQWNITGLIPSLNMVSGKTSFKGLEEIISIAKRIQTGWVFIWIFIFYLLDFQFWLFFRYATGDRNLLYANLALRLHRLELRRLEDGFDRIKTYSHFILNNLYNNGLRNWKNSNLDAIYYKRLRASSARISAILHFKKIIKKSNKSTLRELFYKIKTHSLSRRGFRKKHAGCELLKDVMSKLKVRTLQSPFDIMVNKCTGRKTIIEIIRTQEQPARTSLFGSINQKFTIDREVISKKKHNRPELVLSTDDSEDENYNVSHQEKHTNLRTSHKTSYQGRNQFSNSGIGQNRVMRVQKGKGKTSKSSKASWNSRVNQGGGGRADRVKTNVRVSRGPVGRTSYSTTSTSRTYRTRR